MVKVIHVNQNVIKANHKHGARDPVLTVKDYKSTRRGARSSSPSSYAHEAIIKDKDGNEVARVVYRPDAPLSCGARCWIETTADVELLVGPAGFEPAASAV